MTYTQAGQELVRALDFEYLKKNFLSHPEMSSIVIQAGTRKWPISAGTSARS